MLEEECKRFRSQYEGPAAYPAMWAAKWGGMAPPIKQEKPAASLHPAGGELDPTPPPQGGSPAGAAGTESPYPAAGFFSPTAATTEALYETMSQTYPALSSSLGRR